MNEPTPLVEHKQRSWDRLNLHLWIFDQQKTTVHFEELEWSFAEVGHASVRDRDQSTASTDRLNTKSVYGSVKPIHNSLT